MAESMKGLHRTCRCAEVTKDMVGSKVTLMGWVQKARNKGGLVFVDLRDRSGIRAGKAAGAYVIGYKGAEVQQDTTGADTLWNDYALFEEKWKKIQ